MFVNKLNVTIAKEIMYYCFINLQETLFQFFMGRIVANRPLTQPPLASGTTY